MRCRYPIQRGYVHDLGLPIRVRRSVLIDDNDHVLITFCINQSHRMV